MAVLAQIFALSNPLATLNSYFSQLQPASYNNVPFFTRSNTTTVGRRLAKHIYPFRDTPWMEDIGRRARRYHIVGFLVGDDVISQRNAMQNALEYPGAGVLVHPTYGRLTVSATDECTFEEDVSHGRVIEMTLVFEESGVKIYPGVQPSTSSTLSAAAAAQQSTIGAFVSRVDGYLNDAKNFVTGQVQQATAELETVSQWTGEVGQLANDATNIFNLGSRLAGSFGRFFGANNVGAGAGSITGGYTSLSQVASQIANLTNTATADRANISGAIQQLTTAAGGL